MSTSRLSLAGLKLRSKLILLASLPLVGLLGASGFIFTGYLQDRQEANQEQAEIVRIGLAADVNRTLSDERDAMVTPQTNEVQFQILRDATDSAIGTYRAAVRADPASTTAVEDLERRLEAARNRVGDFAEMMEMQGPALGAQQGADFEAFFGMNILLDDALQLMEPRPEQLQSVGALENARQMRLLTEHSTTLRTELLHYINIANADDTEAANNARNLGIAESGRLEQLETQLLASDDEQFRSSFNEILDSSTYSLLRSTRERVRDAALNRNAAPQSLFLVYRPLFVSVADLAQQQEAEVISAAESTADRALRTLLVSGVALTAFVTVLGLLAAALYRSIRQPLLTLTTQSRQIARHDLPLTVAQIRELGGDAVVEMPEPMVADSDDEVGELVDAFNQLHQTALELATEQAASRRTVSEMFVNLGRRNQKILMRLLASLEKLERNERDPELLEELFRVDHLATRMRRNAESLLVLAGAKSSRSFGSSVPVGDVVRSALAEVEDYNRVTVDDGVGALINGKAVADIGHLLAELIENALNFSPPNTNVEVMIRRGADGLMITVGDRGIGLNPEDIATNNQRILDAARRTETPSRYLGLYVVGRLAHRHGMTVELLEGVPSGVVARIRIPELLYELTDSSPPETSDEIVVRHRPGTEARSAPADTALPSHRPLPSSAGTEASTDAVTASAQPELQRRSRPPIEAAPPAPNHRRSTDTPQPAASDARGFSTAKRVPKGPDSNLAERVRAEPSKSTPEPTINPNRNLAGFQQGVRTPRPAAEPVASTPQAAAGAPVQRIPVASNPSPPNPSTPATPAGEPVAGFAVRRRVPGASSLTKRSDTGPVAAPAAQLSDTAGSAARIGTSLRGFQRAVERADTHAAGDNAVAPLHDEHHNLNSSHHGGPQ